MTKAERGKILRAMREEAGLTRNDLARLADISPMFIHKLESGLSAPSVDTAERIARALSTRLGITAEDIYLALGGFKRLALPPLGEEVQHG